MSLPILFIALAGLMGAAGVGLLAAGAHAAPGAGLDSAGSLLLFHAAALVGLVALLDRNTLGLAARPLALAVGFGFTIGAVLFSADVALRAFAGHRLFPMAAPSGGMLLIAAWLVLTVAAIVGLARG
jgi:uncharacterized membrane protein YgdD (TMEM256/DUF423 family)